MKPSWRKPAKTQARSINRQDSMLGQCIFFQNKQKMCFIRSAACWGAGTPAITTDNWTFVAHDEVGVVKGILSGALASAGVNISQTCQRTLCHNNCILFLESACSSLTSEISLFHTSLHHTCILLTLSMHVAQTECLRHKFQIHCVGS